MLRALAVATVLALGACKSGDKLTSVSESLADERGNKGKLLFVGGSFSEYPPQKGRLFVSQARVARKLGLDPWIAQVRSRPPEYNVDTVLEGINDAPGRVLIVSHSMGGIATLMTLLEHPEVWGTKVWGWVSYQAPFYGSTLVSLGQAWWDPFGIMPALDPDGISAMSQSSTVGARRPYMREHAAAIAELVKKVRIVSVGSDKGRGNDGLVDTASAFLPGSASRKLRGPGHMDLTVDGFGSSETQEEEFIRALMEITDPE